MPYQWEESQDDHSKQGGQYTLRTQRFVSQTTGS